MEIEWTPDGSQDSWLDTNEPRRYLKIKRSPLALLLSVPRPWLVSKLYIYKIALPENYTNNRFTWEIVVRNYMFDDNFAILHGRKIGFVLLMQN